MRNERQRDHFGGALLPAHHEIDACAWRSETGFNKTHRDRRVQSRREPAARNNTDLFAILVDLNAFTRRRAIFERKANTLLGGAFFDFAHDARRARKIAGFAAALLNGPGKVSFNWRRFGIKIMAIEAK